MDEHELDKTQNIPEEEQQGEEEQTTPLELATILLAELLYDRTASNKVAGKKWLKKNHPPELAKEDMETLLEGIDDGQAQEILSGIKRIIGSKDWYYYDSTIMTGEFAALDALIEDKDILATIAKITRSDCKLYPRPTEYSKLTGYPFKFTLDEVEGAAARMALREDYSDIGLVQASNGEKAFFSNRFITEAYARSLLEYSEVESKLWP